MVTRKLADVGDLAAPGKADRRDGRSERASASRPTCPEALIGNIKLGAKLPVARQRGAAPIEGTVVEMAPVADAASRTFLVKLDLPATEGMRSGQFGRVFVADRRERMPIRVSGVGGRGARDKWRPSSSSPNGHAQLRIVRTGKRTGEKWKCSPASAAARRVVIEGAESNCATASPSPLKP